MAKSLVPFALICFIGVSLANADDKFIIQGKVYCDTCRTGFETSPTEKREGGSVLVECRNYLTGNTTYTKEVKVGYTGTYNAEIPEDHEHEICEVVLKENPREGCKEFKEGQNRVGIVLDQDRDIVSFIRATIYILQEALLSVSFDPCPCVLVWPYVISDN